MCEHTTHIYNYEYPENAVTYYMKIRTIPSHIRRCMWEKGISVLGKNVNINLQCCCYFWFLYSKYTIRKYNMRCRQSFPSRIFLFFLKGTMNIDAFYMHLSLSVCFRFYFTCFICCVCMTKFEQDIFNSRTTFISDDKTHTRSSPQCTRKNEIYYVTYYY